MANSLNFNPSINRTLVSLQEDQGEDSVKLAGLIYKVIAVALSIVPILGWALAYILWSKGNECYQNSVALERVSMNLARQMLDGKEGRAKVYSKEKAKQPEQLFTFETLQDVSKISQAFENELALFLKKGNKTLFQDDKDAISFLTFVFDQALNELLEQHEQEPLSEEEALVLVFTFCREKMEMFEGNIGRHHLMTRSSFLDLMGNRLENGKGTKIPINPRLPHVVALTKAYKDGSWKEGEERELFIPECTKELVLKVDQFMLELLDNEHFKRCLYGFVRAE